MNISKSDLVELCEQVLREDRNTRALTDKEYTKMQVIDDFLMGNLGYYHSTNASTTENRWSTLCGWWLDESKGKMTHEQDMGVKDALGLLVNFIVTLDPNELLELQDKIKDSDLKEYIKPVSEIKE